MQRGQDEIRTISTRGQDEVTEESGGQQDEWKINSATTAETLSPFSSPWLSAATKAFQYLYSSIYHSNPQLSISQVLGSQVASQMIQTVGNDLVGCTEGACDPMFLIPAAHDAFHVIQCCLALLHLSGNHGLGKSLLMNSLKHRTWSTILVKDQVIGVANILEVSAAAIAAKAHNGCNCQSNAVGLFLPMLPQDLKKRRTSFTLSKAKSTSSGKFGFNSCRLSKAKRSSSAVSTPSFATRPAAMFLPRKKK